MAKIILPWIPVMILCSDLATNRSDLVNCVTSALVESERRASTPSLPNEPSFENLVQVDPLLVLSQT